MSDAGSQTDDAVLGERWVARALADVSVSESARHTLARFDDRRVCLNVVAASASSDGWLAYSAAAAKRAAATDERLAPLVASGQLDGAFYVAYDVGAAATLAAYRERTDMSTAQSLQLLWGIARALDIAVKDGILPIEVTPDSVFVDPTKGAVLTDLGVAREALGNPPAAIDANAAWVAPEILLGEDADERSAVYSYGALMYTLLTGSVPHRGHPDEIAAADPPSVLAVRPDLPEALDLVLATAMARDPQRRYRSASEARSLAHVVLQDSLKLAPPEPRRRFSRRPAEVDPDRETRNGMDAASAERSARRAGRAPDREPSVSRATRSAPRTASPDPRTALPAPRTARAAPATPGTARRARLAAALLLVGALAGGALAGALLLGGDESPPAKPVRVAAGDLALLAPAGWQRSPSQAGALVVQPEGDRASGLTLERVESPVETAEQATPVRIGKVEAWRDTGAQVAGVAGAVRYVIPTTSGKLVATCRASASAGPGTLRLCERSLSTLRLPAATGLPLADVVERQQRWQDATARLSEQRTGARRALARADRPHGQLLAAEALARVHERAATRFSALPGGADVAAAARRTSVAYTVLARRAGSNSASWNFARERVRRNEAALRQALASASG